MTTAGGFAGHPCPAQGRMSDGAAGSGSQDYHRLRLTQGTPCMTAAVDGAPLILPAAVVASACRLLLLLLCTTVCLSVALARLHFHSSGRPTRCRLDCIMLL
jgi:hypothetical protein